MCLFTSLVMLADQLLGGRLSYQNFFGYSSLLAARFYGMGNEAAAMLVGSSVVGMALAFDQWPDSRFGSAARRYAIPVVGILVVGTAAAPFLGANVGVAVWGLVGFVLAWVLMNGYRVNWKTGLIALALIVAVVVTFSAIDLFGGGEQTHLGRALASAEQGGASQLWTIAVRKAQTNARVFTRTNWSWILVAVLALLAFARFRPKGDFAGFLADNPFFAHAITVTLATGIVAFFTEDSGIVIPSLIMLYTGVGLAWLMLARLCDPDPEAAT
jgi:hypothetical protein